jgi:hypothetical protein
VIPQGQILTFGALRISSDAVEEFQDNRSVIRINRQEIRSIRLSHGFLARHPLLQTIFGILVITISGFFSLAGIAELQARIIDFWTLSPTLFVVLGIWIIYDATKRGYYVQIYTADKSHKLLIGRSLTQPEQSEITRELSNS